MIIAADKLDQLPTLPGESLQPAILEALRASGKTIIVLDDDPTGTQTVHDVPVLTGWDIAAISKELAEGTAVFFILTNSRSMDKAAAIELNELIGNNIREALEAANKSAMIISRSDSTLRGHYPHEITALTNGLQTQQQHNVIIPAFFEGSRYTIDDIHYVQEGNQLVPAAETAFAKDKAFGFSHSNLKNWVAEKTGNAIAPAEVHSFSISELRTDTTARLAEKIKALPTNATIIVNAVDYYDLEKFALAYFQSGVKMIFRTAASFVKVISGATNKGLLQRDILFNAGNANGGLIVVGSYVPKTTAQLNYLLQQRQQLVAIEIPVQDVLNESLHKEELAASIDGWIHQQKNVLIYTSRELKYGNDEKKSLDIGNKVSDFITGVVACLQVQPRFLVAKGGITSSDIATKALQIKRAVVLGQALPGVPVWRAGNESKFPGMSYIIFPGNVGADDALVALFERLK